ncbi:hypothetical protein GLOIN_2v812944 [Rhizophagus clarus]|nr:hypothetical protein GLOIN_2v812944 [Rhizophagus clarus]
MNSNNRLHKNVLNNGINVSRIFDYLFSHHHNIQSLLQQQIQQRVQKPVVYQQSGVQQSFNTIQPSQAYSNNNTYDITSFQQFFLICKA